MVSQIKSCVLAICTICVITGCDSKENEIKQVEKNPISVDDSATNDDDSVNDTILNVNYESGTLNSNVVNVVPTKAPAEDAAYMQSPGHESDYAIAYKVTLGDPGYYSNDAYRSESDAININEALFFPDMERRYEFSVYLKDWEEWNPAIMHHYGDNIFQLKVSGGDPVPVRILTRRNAILARYDASGVGTIIPDFRPQINKWIDFRIDVKWTLNNTGYFKIYTKYEGEDDYTLRLENTQARTFTGTQLNNGQKGYIKWGVYREAGKDANGDVILTDNVLTRIAYHDNIRIIALD